MSTVYYRDPKKGPIIKSKVQKEKEWRMGVSFGMTEGGYLEEAKRKRLPLAEEKQSKRLSHMQKLKEDGASYAQIGRLYRMSRSQARKIILEQPNN